MRGEENKGLAAPQKASGGMEDGDGMKNMPVAGGENQNQLITGRSARREREEEGKHVETTPRRQQFGIPSWIRSVVKAIPSARDSGSSEVSFFAPFGAGDLQVSRVFNEWRTLRLESGSLLNTTTKEGREKGRKE